MGYSSSARRRITFVQEQKSLRNDYYSSPESFKRFGECCVYRVTSTMETPIHQFLLLIQEAEKQKITNQQLQTRLQEQLKEIEINKQQVTSQIRKY